MPIVAAVRESPSCDFYRTILWQDTPSDTPLEKLPPFTRTDYAQAPFLSRLYRDHGLLTKVAYHSGKPFLIGRHLEDIASEEFGALGDRPLIALSSTHEGIEKSLWSYSRNILPLIAASDPDITAMLASRYEADSLITDSTALPILLPALAQHYALARFRHISVIDTAFDLPLLKKMFPASAITLVLGLPETGSIALSCPTALAEGRIAFHAAQHRHLEHQNELTVTDDRVLPTPLIRYRPGIAIRFLEASCICTAAESFALAEHV
jgi:hypothetical protein